MQRHPSTVLSMARLQICRIGEKSSPVQTGVASQSRSRCALLTSDFNALLVYYAPWSRYRSIAATDIDTMRTSCGVSQLLPGNDLRSSGFGRRLPAFCGILKRRPNSGTLGLTEIGFVVIDQSKLLINQNFRKRQNQRKLEVPTSKAFSKPETPTNHPVIVSP